MRKTTILSSVALLLWAFTVLEGAPLTGVRDGAAKSVDRKIELEGNKAFPTQELLGQINQCLDRYDQPRSEDEYRGQLKECLSKILFSMKTQGYLRAATGEPRVEASEHGTKTIVPITEGARYRFGEIRIKGSRLFSPAQIIEILDIKTGDIADTGKIGTILYGRLSDLYADHGYVLFTVEPAPTFRPGDNGQDGIVDFDFQIDEGRRFTIGKINFEGTRLATDQDLRSALLVHEGDIYNQQLLYDSIERLNQSGSLKIDRIRDVDFDMDGEEATELTVVIHLNQRGEQRGGQESTQ
jgi:outer membrane protein insertion porin family